MPEIGGGDPRFRDDDGSADPRVAAVLAGFAQASRGEQAVLTALAASRLLVPVVPMPADRPAGPAASAHSSRSAEGTTEMAMPTLIGFDGRPAIPAFTCAESLRRWRQDARPVPVLARAVWQTARAQSSAVVIDIAGPVPLAVEGARLAALAEGVQPPPPHADPDVREVVAGILARQLEVASFELEPGGEEHDLAIVLNLSAAAARDLPDDDVAQLGATVVAEVMTCLSGRLRRGVAVWLGSRAAAG